MIGLLRVDDDSNHLASRPEIGKLPPHVHGHIYEVIHIIVQYTSYRGCHKPTGVLSHGKVIWSNMTG